MTPESQSRPSLQGNDTVNRFPRQRISKQQSKYVELQRWKRCFLLDSPRDYITKTPGQLKE
jgi:hypothetical protein